MEDVRGGSTFSSWAFFVVVVFLEKKKKKKETKKKSGRVGRRSGWGFRLRRCSVGLVWLSAASRSGRPRTVSTVPLTSGGRRGELRRENWGGGSLDWDFTFRKQRSKNNELGFCGGEEN